jgi:hypothetical protein
MARYFFDIRDGELFTPDETGIELRCEYAAMDEAAITLAALARAIQLRGSTREVSVEVQDAAKQPLFEARLTVHANTFAKT